MAAEAQHATRSREQEAVAPRFPAPPGSLAALHEHLSGRDGDAIRRPAPVVSNVHSAMDDTLCAMERVRAVFRSATSDLMEDVVNAEGIEAAKRRGLEIWMILVAAEQMLDALESPFVLAARALPDSPEIESRVADGMTLESALKKLNWDDGDLLVVGSSRVAAPRRIFLGSTAARILAGVDVPVIVVPRDE